MKKKIISLLLALAVVFTMVPAAFAADPTEVADFNALKTAVAAGGSIKLTADITATEALSVANGVEVVLDLGGFDIIAGSGITELITVKMGGKLTVNDADNSGCITNNNPADFDTPAHAIMNFGELIVNGGTITGDYALSNGAHSIADAKADLVGGVFNTSAIGYYSVVNYGVLNISDNADINDSLSSAGALTMTGGEVEELVAASAEATVASGNTTAVTGGKVDYMWSLSYAGAVSNNSVSVSGNAEVGDLNVLVQDGVAAANAVSVTGGKIGEVHLTELSADGQTESAATDAEGLEISGGLFDVAPPETVLASDKDIIVPKGGQGFKVGDVANAQAMDPVSGTYYEDAADAFAAADEVILNPDMPEGAEIVVPEGKNAYTGFVDPANKVEPGKYVADANGDLAPAEHVHTPKTEWDMDAAAHWHRCADCGEICTEFGAHFEVYKDGRCDDCGWYLAETAGRQNPSTGVGFFAWLRGLFK